jgi:hypothetical protein
MRTASLLILFSLLIFSTSCEENFSPFGELRDEYVFNCTLRGDSTLHFASISKSYYAEFNPSLSNPAERFIGGADIRIWRGDSVYRFKDSLVYLNRDGEDVPLNVYCTDNFIPEANNILQIEALTPDGKRLKASTRIPTAPRFRKSEIDTIIPPPDGTLNLKWAQDEPDLIYAPEINMYYFKRENGKKVRKIGKIPLEYLSVKGEYVPSYPKPGKASAFSISKNTIDRFMRGISEGDPNKGDYTILSVIVDVHVYDINLSNYYVSTTQKLDDFSVQLEAVNFSNIEGGLGIFGSFISTKHVLKFDSEYVGSFGYVPGIRPIASRK